LGQYSDPVPVVLAVKFILQKYWPSRKEWLVNLFSIQFLFEIFKF
jgi:hypothetical protein